MVHRQRPCGRPPAGHQKKIPCRRASTAPRLSLSRKNCSSTPPNRLHHVCLESPPRRQERSSRSAAPPAPRSTAIEVAPFDGRSGCVSSTASRATDEGDSAASIFQSNQIPAKCGPLSQCTGGFSLRARAYASGAGALGPDAVVAGSITLRGELCRHSPP